MGRLSWPVRFELAGRGWRVSAESPRGLYALDIVGRWRIGDPTNLLDDFDFGDPRFRRLYAASGTPPDFLRSLIDERTRKRIMGLGLESVRATDGWIELSKRYNYYYAEPDHITEAIELAVDLARRASAGLRDLQDEVLSSARTADSPYRGALDVDRVVEAIAERDTQLAVYRERRIAAVRRDRRAIRRLMLFAAFYVGAVALLSLTG